MHLEHEGSEIDGRGAGHAAPQRGRDTVSRSSPPSLELARSQPGCRYLTSGDQAVSARHHAVAAGELAVRWERRRAAWILWLSGALDEATATLLDRELDTRAIGTMRLVVDLTGLEFIDSPGLDALVRVHWRASTRGNRLFFRNGQHVAQRPVELTRAVRLRSRNGTPPAGVSDEDSYFALAMACVDVDHPRPPVVDPGAA